MNRKPRKIRALKSPASKRKRQQYKSQRNSSTPRTKVPLLDELYAERKEAFRSTTYGGQDFGTLRESLKLQRFVVKKFCKPNTQL